MSTNIKKTFGASIKAIRNEKGLSQENLSENSGLHRTYIASVETGQRNVSLCTIQSLAMGLGIEISDIFLRVESQDDERRTASKEEDS